MKTTTFNGNYLLHMFVFTLVDSKETDLIIPFYYSLKKLQINEQFNFVFYHRDIYRLVKMLRLNINLHLHEEENTSFISTILKPAESFLYVKLTNFLTKDPIPLFKDALTRSEVVFYENKFDYNIFGANYTEDFKFYYPTMMEDYDLYLQKNEGNIYTLPSCGLTTTEPY